MNVKAVHLPKISIDPPSPAGTFAFYASATAETSGILFACPCGCDTITSINFEADGRPQWTWDGNREAPTVSPSVRRLDGCQWHGWLRNGEWISC